MISKLHRLADNFQSAPPIVINFVCTCVYQLLFNETGKVGMLKEGVEQEEQETDLKRMGERRIEKEIERN